MRRLFIVILSGFFLLGVFSSEAKIQAAEQYPVKTIVCIVALEAGSDGDVMVRPIAQKVSAILGQPIVIVNKPGAGSTLGYREIYTAKPDGYTIGWGATTLITTKLQGLFPYDYRDYTFLYSYLSWYPVLLSSTKTKRPFKSFEEVYSYAKAHPGEVSLATGGVGQMWWIFTMAFQEVTGLKFNVIPQPGTGAFTVAQVAGGHTDLGILAMGAAKPMIEAGTIRFLTVLGDAKAPGYDNVPTLKELGYDLKMTTINSIIGPPKMPKDITNKLVKAFDVAIRDPEYQKYLVENNAAPIFMPGEQSLKAYDDLRKAYQVIMSKFGLLKEK